MEELSSHVIIKKEFGQRLEIERNGAKGPYLRMKLLTFANCLACVV